MREVFPNYYSKFKCIADKCKHSCCIGWEIDIDDETMELYNSLDGKFAQRIRDNIEGDIPHFKLDENERCPFLGKSGLCDIILELGEGALCDICYLHPRFSNFYNDFTETGLGLCCEEAVRIILTQQEKFYIALPQAVENPGFFEERNQAFDILQNRDIKMLARFKNLAEKYDLKFGFSNKELFSFYSSLERLDVKWVKELEKLKNAEGTDVFEREDLQILFEQLACYFVFRHFENGIGFALLSCWTLGMMFSDCTDIEYIFDIVRMYSSEIEYSEDNVQKVCAFMK